MSLYSFASASEVAEKIKSGVVDKDWAVVDVRDSDYMGGHIPKNHHVPSDSFPNSVSKLVKELKDVKTVVFHCALSQQRGPSAARMYAEARETAIASGSIAPAATAKQDDKKGGQEVWVMSRGFTGFVGKYKGDKELVEGYRAEIWG